MTKLHLALALSTVALAGCAGTNRFEPRATAITPTAVAVTDAQSGAARVVRSDAPDAPVAQLAPAKPSEKAAQANTLGAGAYERMHGAGFAGHWVEQHH